MPGAPRRPPEKNVGTRFSFPPVSRILNALAFTETGHGERMGVVCRLAAGGAGADRLAPRWEAAGAAVGIIFMLRFDRLRRFATTRTTTLLRLCRTGSRPACGTTRRGRCAASDGRAG